MLLFKVEYNDDNFIKIINEIFDISNQIYPGWRKNDPSVLLDYCSALTSNLITILPRIKNKDYHDEKEWRIWIPILIGNQNLFTANNGFFISDLPSSKIPPFVKNMKTSIPRLRSPKFEYNDLDSIIVGPRLDFKKARFAIEKILINAGITETQLKNIKIKESKRPYQ